MSEASSKSAYLAQVWVRLLNLADRQPGLGGRAVRRSLKRLRAPGVPHPAAKGKFRTIGPRQPIRSLMPAIAWPQLFVSLRRLVDHRPGGRRDRQVARERAGVRGTASAGYEMPSRARSSRIICEPNCQGILLDVGSRPFIPSFFRDSGIPSVRAVGRSGPTGRGRRQSDRAGPEIGRRFLDSSVTPGRTLRSRAERPIMVHNGASRHRG